MKKTKKQKTLRPTTGKVREALFDILRGSVNNALFLDLFAGSGAVGIEALKQGAAAAVFVEESKSSSRKIKEYIIKKNLSENTRIITQKVLSFIDRAEAEQEAFDIIFLDPPYQTDLALLTLSAIGNSRILSPGGVVIAEHSTRKKLPQYFDGLAKSKDYVYGDTTLSFYETP